MKSVTGFLLVAVVVTWAVIDFDSLESVVLILADKLARLVPALFEAFAGMVRTLSEIVSSEVSES